MRKLVVVICLVLFTTLPVTGQTTAQGFTVPQTSVNVELTTDDAGRTAGLMLIGAALGAMAGAIAYGMYLCLDPEGDGCEEGSSDEALYWVAGGAILGGALGAGAASESQVDVIGRPIFSVNSGRATWAVPRVAYQPGIRQMSIPVFRFIFR